MNRPRRLIPDEDPPWFKWLKGLFLFGFLALMALEGLAAIIMAGK